LIYNIVAACTGEGGFTRREKESDVILFSTFAHDFLEGRDPVGGRLAEGGSFRVWVFGGEWGFDSGVGVRLLARSSVFSEVRFAF
jgi:hypothetical protein